MRTESNRNTSGVDRRNFIKAALAGGAALAVACGSDDGPERSTRAAKPIPVAAQQPDSDDWAKVRSQFALTDDKIHMSALLIAANPAPVREAIERHRRGLDVDPVGYLNENNSGNEDETLRAAARYLGASHEDIAITDSTTMGLGLIYNGIKIGPGQEFLTTEQNYYSTDEAIRLKCGKSGATYRTIPMYSDINTVTIDELTSRILNAILPETRVVALTWVHSSTGLKLPVRQISGGISEINATREPDQNILLAVDGVHGFGIEDVEMADLECDYFAAGCHKWLFGPRGTGIVWASAKGWENIEPTIPTFSDNSVRNAWITGRGISGPTTGRRLTPGGFKPFEHQWAMADAFDFMLDIGKDRVEARTRELASRLKQGLAEMEHVDLVTPQSEDISAGIVCFDVAGYSSGGAVNALGERGIVASVTPYAFPHARLTPSIVNTTAEIDFVLETIRGMA